MSRQFLVAVYFDCFGKLIVRLGIIEAPPAQKGDQGFSRLLRRLDGDDSGQRLPGLD